MILHQTPILEPLSGPQRKTDVRLRGRWLVVMRVVWVAIVLFDLSVFIASIPVYYAQLHLICTHPTPQGCLSGELQLTAGNVLALHRLGLSLDSYALYTLSLALAVSLVFMVVGAIIFWHKSAERMGLFVSLWLIVFGASHVADSQLGTLALAQTPQVVVLVFSFLEGAIWPGLILFLCIFPDGRFIPRWAWLLVIPPLIILVLPSDSPFNPPNWPLPLFAAAEVLALGSPLGLQLYRYLRVSDAVQRQQTKWLVFGFTITFLLALLVLNLVRFLPALGQPDSVYQLIPGTAFSLVFLCIPLTLGFAILRYRLWDIDLLINRTLVYGTLTVSVIGLYVLVVTGLGTLFQTQGNLLIALLATGMIAVLFQPLRARLQRAVNRLMFGERDDPYRVLSRLGQRLEATLAPDAVLPAIVETVAQALKLPYAAILLQVEGEWTIAASYGRLHGEPLSVPLVYQTEPVGKLQLAPRTPGESFTRADQRLLDDLTRQAGAAIHAVSLTTDLQRLTIDLQRSRERLVTMREEERRRLRRDLHDGLGPALATLTLKAEAARDLVATEPAQAVGMLEDLIGQSQVAITDIRRLVYDLRPPALDDLGLVAAMRTQVMHYEHAGLRVTIEAPEHLPPLPAAVEVAAYRIMQEALTNVVRHAQAHSCQIHLTLGETLDLSIIDDGRGIPANRQAGVGLRSMQERTAELGGSCIVEALPTSGTRVYARLPCVPREM
jgi:signal transduction histidine kinase